MNIENLSEILGIDLEGEGYETLGGFILARLGRLPHPGEWIDVQGFRFIVTKLVKRRISKVRVVRLPCPKDKTDREIEPDTGDKDVD